MCQSMVNIQSPTAEISRGKKKIERKKKKETTGQKYNGPLLHRAAIKKETTGQQYNGLPYYIGRP